MAQFILALSIHIFIYTPFATSLYNACDPPNFATMVYKGPKFKAAEGTWLVVDCEINYIRKSFSVICQSDGKWSEPTGKCKLVTCPLPEYKPHSILDMAGRRYNDTATYTCFEGFWFNGTKTMRCKRDGTWTPTAGNCEAVECPLLSIENGNVTYTNRTYKGEASITCDKGYVYTEPNSTRHCLQNNTWSMKDGQCEGEVTSTERMCQATDGVQCNDGYVSSVPNSTTRTGEEETIASAELSAGKIGWIVLGTGLLLCLIGGLGLLLLRRWKGRCACTSSSQRQTPEECPVEVNSTAFSSPENEQLQMLKFH